MILSRNKKKTIVLTLATLILSPFFIAGSASIGLSVVYGQIPFGNGLPAGAVGLFGGKLISYVQCTCSGGHVMIVGPPRANRVKVLPGYTRIYPYGQVKGIGQWQLGVVSPPTPCLVNAFLFCVPVPHNGDVMVVGTSGEIEQPRDPIVDTTPGGSGTCDPLSSGPCTPENLADKCDWNANDASQVCNVESGGVADRGSSVDVVADNGACGSGGGLPFSTGLFQVNLRVHKIGGLDCPSAFTGSFKWSGGQVVSNTVTIVDCPLYRKCVAAANDPALNIAKACELYGGRGRNWADWLVTANKCNLPTSGSIAPNTSNTSDTPIGNPHQDADNSFDYNDGIEAQVAHASPELRDFLNCMVDRVPADVGRISSISDSLIVSGSRTFQQCSGGGCAHTSGSCHYGGASCVGSSYAVDFGDQENHSFLRDAALACNPEAFVLFEGNHSHISIGQSAGCGCN